MRPARLDQGGERAEIWNLRSRIPWILPIRYRPICHEAQRVPTEASDDAAESPPGGRHGSRNSPVGICSREALSARFAPEQRVCPSCSDQHDERHHQRPMQCGIAASSRECLTGPTEIDPRRHSQHGRQPAQDQRHPPEPGWARFSGQTGKHVHFGEIGLQRIAGRTLRRHLDHRRARQGGVRLARCRRQQLVRIGAFQQFRDREGLNKSLPA